MIKRIIKFFLIFFSLTISTASLAANNCEPVIGTYRFFSGGEVITLNRFEEGYGAFSKYPPTIMAMRTNPYITKFESKPEGCAVQIFLEYKEPIFKALCRVTILKASRAEIPTIKKECVNNPDEYPDFFTVSGQGISPTEYFVTFKIDASKKKQKRPL